MTFSEKLKKARKNKKLTQGELAELCGLHYRTIQNWEAGERRPAKMEHVRVVAAALEVKPEDLFSDCDLLILSAREKGGERAAEDIEALITQVSGLFAGGELAEEDKDKLIEAFNKAYWLSKEKSGESTVDPSVEPKTPATQEEAGEGEEE